MVEMVKKQPHWWWFEGHNSPKRSPWLQSTLTELDEKTKAVVKLIEEDADSFAQRVEMYYKKRPELINMVEELYRAHRSLAERHDQVSGPRAVTTLGNPLLTRYRAEKVTSIVDESYDTYSETFDPSEFGDSEVEDPEQEDETRVDKEMEEAEVSSGVCNEEVMKLRECVEGLKKENKIQKDRLMQKDEERKHTSVACNEELMKLRKDLESLKEENKIQKDQLIQKDEEKREVIRQLSLAVEMLKEENFNLKKKCIARNSNKKSNRPLEFNKLKGVIWGKLFSGSSKSETSIVAL